MKVRTLVYMDSLSLSIILANSVKQIILLQISNVTLLVHKCWILIFTCKNLSYSVFQLHFSHIYIHLEVDLASTWTRVESTLIVLELRDPIGL